MTRPVLIGQAPGPKTDPAAPLHPGTSLTGRRLATLLGLSDGEYLEGFDRLNLVYEYPGKVGKEDVFPMAQARASARLLSPLLAGRRVVLLGRGVSTAFGLVTLPWMTWTELELGPHREPATVAAIPHPSGRCRVYNDPTQRGQVETFLRTLVKKDGGEVLSFAEACETKRSGH